LNMVFDAIAFVYPDYHYPLRRQGKKRKTAALATSVVPKGKKIKVLTHRSRYIEPAIVPEFGKGTSSTVEAKQVAPVVQSAEESIVVPTVGPAEAKDDTAEEPKVEKTVKMPEILSPPTEAELPKVQKAPAATPKRRRMASVLDAVMETTKALTPAPIKKVAEAVKVQAEAEAGPSVAIETKPAAPEDKTEQQTSDTGKAAGQIVIEKVEAPAPEAPSEDINYIIRHASGKRISKEEVLEAKHYARKLKYPEGALVFNGTDEDDFLYCLPDNKEISVCREIAKSMGFPKLEEGLLAMSKDDLADSLAYNSIKVQKLLTLKLEMKYFIVMLNSFFSLQGLILSNALWAQKNVEDESCTIALINLRSEVIELRHEGLEKDKILISLVSKMKEDEAKYNAQVEAQKGKVEELRKKLTEANENYAVAKASKEISEWTQARLEKNIEELRESKERCFDKSLDCVKNLKNSFAKVGAYSSEENFIRGDPEGVIEWISGEVKAFEENLNNCGDICAFSDTQGVAAILEKAGCEHVKAVAQAEAAFSLNDTKDPSAEATLMGRKFYSDVWVNGGRELAHEIIKKNEKDTHDAREEARRTEEAVERERCIGIVF
jgi:hypothetical protein